MREYHNARAENHFHDPTRPAWDAGLQAGLTGSSAAVWGENHPGNEWALDDFYFYLERAFISPDAAEREDNVALAMKSAGHLLHLLQDMGVPAHTRNDFWTSHFGSVKNSIFLVPGSPFESYVAKNSHLIEGVSPSDVPEFETFGEYFDTGQYAADSSKPVSGRAYGLAEYTHSNFFGDYQHFIDGWIMTGRGYANPSIGAAEQYDYRVDTIVAYPHLSALLPTFFYSSYLRLPSSIPEQNHEFLGRLGFFGKYGIFRQVGTSVFLDERCWQEYASKLAPQAVAYSAGLLEYLFRGDIDFHLDNAAGTLLITNNSSRDMSGLFTLYYDNSDGLRETMAEWQWPLSIPAGQDVMVPSEVSLPRDIGLETFLTMTFRGTLGQSDNVVTGVAKKLSSYEFTAGRDVTYGEIQPPAVFDRMGGPDPASGYATRSYQCEIHFRDSLSSHTVWRSNDTFLYVMATPELAKKLGYSFQEGQKYAINTNSYTFPGLVEHFIVETAPGTYTYVFDRSGSHEDSGWGGTSRPLRYYEGAWQAGSYYVAAYSDLGRLLNFADECSPDYYEGGHPEVNLALRYSYPDRDPYCSNADSILQYGAALCSDYQTFYNYSLSVANTHRQIVSDPDWGNYGFEVRLNRLEAAFPQKGKGVIFDGPVTFTKRYGDTELLVQ